MFEVTYLHDFGRSHAEDVALAGAAACGAAVVAGLPALLLALFPWQYVCCFYLLTTASWFGLVAMDGEGR
jgi:hypothetical protein